jgi:2-methylcitrate dehydratase PrpD
MDRKDTAVELIQFCRNLEFEALPVNAIDSAKRALIDALAAVLIGARSRFSKNLVSLLDRSSEQGSCTVIGTGARTDVVSASFTNAAFAQVFDFNDGFSENDTFGGSIHPGRIVVPVGLAFAEHNRASGKELLTAMIAGYETALRVRGLSPSPMSDCYGAAMAASRLMDLDEVSTRNALGLAACFSPRNFPENAGEFDSDFLRMGYKAKAAADAALLSQNGFTGPPLEDDPALSLRFKNRGLGEEYLIAGLYFKPYPTCRAGHGVLDTLIKWKHTEENLCKRLQKLRISVVSRSSYVRNFVVQEDSYYKSAQYSLSYAAACALLDGKVDEHSFSPEQIANEQKHKLMEQIEIVVEDSLEGLSSGSQPAVKTELWTNDGLFFEQINTAPKGSPQNPLSDRELRDKVFKCNGGLLPEDSVMQMFKSVMHLETLESVFPLTELLSPDDQKNG